MRAITGNSTFEDIQKLLVDEDEFLFKQIGYLKDEKFKNKTDKGYRCRNLHFFMAIVLQGVSSAKDKPHTINFLHILYPDPQRSTYESDRTWRRNAGDFVNGKGNIDIALNDKLKTINPKTTINSFFDGTWYDLKDSDNMPIFYNSLNNESVFSESEGQSGEMRAKTEMRQIADFLVNGTQITSEGDFSLMTDAYSLLKTNKQLIMNGAPGTGKTFSARNEIADKLFDIKSKKKEEKEVIKDIRMDMVQFHPSYDYTDFIEGIRPNLKGESIGYTMKNGSFKRFCRRAGVIERIIAAEKIVTDETIELFLKGEDAKIVTFWKNYLKEIGEISKDNFNSVKLPSFLFIIDEINRAEISKVLGETMFCLDADYRGATGKISTQYSAMATEESFYIDKENDKFFIPSNVYIIGTMNDIDRSVEVFDFALRRRFAWHEVKAEDVMDNVLKEMKIDTLLGNDYEDYCKRINELNSAIQDLLKLNRNYYLGPSYFAKIELYWKENNYITARKEVWKNHILQILREYVKGKRTESELGIIEKEFCE